MLFNAITRPQFYATTVLLSALVGCGGGGGSATPKTFPVTGTLRYEDAPVVGATVTLLPKASGAGPGATGVTDASGDFSLGTFDTTDGAIPGEYYVRVFKYKIVIPPKSALDAADEQSGHSITENELPAKYADSATSGLTHSVPEGPTRLDLNLE